MKRTDPATFRSATGEASKYFALAAAIIGIACVPERAVVSRTPSPPKAVEKATSIDYSILGRIERPDDIVWSFDDESAPVERHVVERAIARALSTWERSGLVRFRRAAGAEPSRLAFAFHGDDRRGCPPFIDWLGQVGHAGASDTALWVHLDGDSHWTEKGDGDTKSLDATILHEVGHVLGLGHSRDERAVMHERYDASKTELGHSDLAALTTLYGSREPRKGDVSIAPPETGDHAVVPLLVLVGVLDLGVEHGMCFLDLDGDRRDELVLWERRSAKGNAARVFFFDEHGRLVKTLGPFIGILPEQGEPLLGVGRDTDDRVLLVPLEDEWYRAFAIDGEGRPIIPQLGGGSLRLDHAEWTDDEGRAHRITEFIAGERSDAPRKGPLGETRLSAYGRPFGSERLEAIGW